VCLGLGILYYITNATSKDVQRPMTQVAQDGQEHNYLVRMHAWYLSKELTHDVVANFMRAHEHEYHFCTIYPNADDVHGLAASFRAYIMNDQVYWATAADDTERCALAVDFCVCANIVSSLVNFPQLMLILNHRVSHEHKSAEELLEDHNRFLQATQQRGIYDLQHCSTNAYTAEFWPYFTYMSQLGTAQATELDAPLLLRMQTAVSVVSTRQAEKEQRRRYYAGRQHEQFAHNMAAPPPDASQQHTPQTTQADRPARPLVV